MKRPTNTHASELNVKDHGITVQQLQDMIKKKGYARLLHFGSFRVVKRKNRRRYDFLKGKVVEHTGTTNIVLFTPSVEIKRLINK